MTHTPSSSLGWEGRPQLRRRNDQGHVSRCGERHTKLTLTRQSPSTVLRLLDSFTKYTSEESGEFSTWTGLQRSNGYEKMNTINPQTPVKTNRSRCQSPRRWFPAEAVKNNDQPKGDRGGRLPAMWMGDRGPSSPPSGWRLVVVSTATAGSAGVSPNVPVGPAEHPSGVVPSPPVDPS